MDKNKETNIKVEAEAKMTLEEKLKAYKAGKVALRIPTEIIYDKIMAELEGRGECWGDGTMPTNKDKRQHNCRHYGDICLINEKCPYGEIAWTTVSDLAKIKMKIIDLADSDFKPKDVNEKKMTLKEKIDLFCAKEIALHVPTKELFIKVCGELKQRGIKWRNGRPADYSPYLWDFHCEATVMTNFNDEGMMTTNRNLHRDKVIVEITENDFRPNNTQEEGAYLKATAIMAVKGGKENDEIWISKDGVVPVTFFSTHGDSRKFHAVVVKLDNGYTIREVDIPKFAKDEKFTDENGVLGRIDDIHDRTYDCEMVTGEKYALRIDEADKKFKKITW